jgi:hypothetical protein
MRFLYAIAALVSVGALDGCITNSSDSRSSVSLTRTACYGPCPVYRFTLYSDGRYVWEGRAHVSVKGIVRGSMDAKAYATATQLLRDARYQEFTGSLVCEIFATDNPTVEIAVADASGQQTITHHRGCRGFARQEDLTSLEDNLDKVFRTRRFTG